MGNLFSISLSLDTIITRCWDSAVGKAAFLCKLEENFHALKNEVEELEAIRTYLMSRVRVAEDEQQLAPRRSRQPRASPTHSLRCLCGNRTSEGDGVECSAAQRSAVQCSAVQWSGIYAEASVRIIHD